VIEGQGKVGGTVKGYPRAEMRKKQMFWQTKKVERTRDSHESSPRQS